VRGPRNPRCLTNGPGRGHRPARVSLYATGSSCLGAAMRRPRTIDDASARSFRLLNNALCGDPGAVYVPSASGSSVASSNTRWRGARRPLDEVMNVAAVSRATDDGESLSAEPAAAPRPSLHLARIAVSRAYLTPTDQRTTIFVRAANGSCTDRPNGGLDVATLSTERIAEQHHPQAFSTRRRVLLNRGRRGALQYGRHGNATITTAAPEAWRSHRCFYLDRAAHPSNGTSCCR
jgi:hypothetical protein